MILRLIQAISSQLKIPNFPNFVLFWCKIDDCGQTTNFRCRRPMPFNCIFYCGSFDIYHSGLARSVLFFVTVYIVKISTVYAMKRK